MSVSRATRLKPVVEMAEKAEREAARQMGACQAQLQQAEGKLGDLQRYCMDYQQQMVTQGQQGVTGQWLMNYQRFLSQLDNAIAQQQRNVDWHRSNVDKVRTMWQERYARLEGLRKLVERYMYEARLAEDRREQRQLDELSQRLTARKQDH